MNINETKQLLSRVAAVDNRDLSEAMAVEWHDLIGHLQYSVADRALTLARKDPMIDWIQPKHILMKARDAITELNKEEQVGKIPDEANWQGVSKPDNFDEMVQFYRELWRDAPWDRYIKTSAMTVGTSHTAPRPIVILASDVEIDRRARESARRLGRAVPEARWSN